MLSFDESDLLDDESDDDGYGSGSPGICAFPFCSGKTIGSVGKSVGCVHGVGSGVFVPTRINLIGDVVLLVVFVPKVFKSKGGRLIEVFWLSKT